MKQSLFVVLVFIIGCVAGSVFELDWDLHDASLYILYALMLQVGISVGSSDTLKEMIKNFHPKMLLLPLGTVTGTLLFSAMASLLLFRYHWSATDCMAVGSGMGYYSVSSIIITQLKMESLGAQLATELGTIALLANICREISALVFAPLLVRFFGPLATISAAGVTSVDVAMPAIVRYSGKEMIPVALFHGMMLDLSVPLLVPFLCEL